MQSGDVDAMLKGDPGLRARIRASLREGGSSFQKGYERWAAGDWDLSPSPSRSQSREPADNTKSKPQPSRSRSQRSSRSISSRKSRRKKKKRKARYSSDSSSEDRDRKRPRGSTSPSQEGKKEAEKVNLATASISQLRALCVKHGVLPAGLIEKGDLVNALTTFYPVQEPRAQHTPTPTPTAQPQGRAPRVSKFDMMTAPPPKETKIMGLNIPVPSKAPSGPAGQSFTRAAIQAMSSKELRTLCMERKVLPPGPVERSELLQALAPLASG